VLIAHNVGTVKGARDVGNGAHRLDGRDERCVDRMLNQSEIPYAVDGRNRAHVRDAVAQQRLAHIAHIAIVAARAELEFIQSELAIQFDLGCDRFVARRHNLEIVAVVAGDVVLHFLVVGALVLEKVLLPRPSIGVVRLGHLRVIAGVERHHRTVAPLELLRLRATIKSVLEVAAQTARRAFEELGLLNEYVVHCVAHIAARHGFLAQQRLHENRDRALIVDRQLQCGRVCGAVDCQQRREPITDRRPRAIPQRSERTRCGGICVVIVGGHAIDIARCIARNRRG